jgi:hypothetical protein
MPITLSRSLAYLTAPALATSIALFFHLRLPAAVHLETYYTLPSNRLVHDTILQHHVNPANHPACIDVHEAFLRVPKSYRQQVQQQRDRATSTSAKGAVSDEARRTDEELLAAFTRGYFGGVVCALERTALSLWKADFVDVASVKKMLGSHMATESLWGGQPLHEGVPLGLGTKLWGAFLVVDTSVGRNDGDEGGQSGEAYTSWLFGSDEGMLRGMHRFSIRRVVDGLDDAVAKAGREVGTTRNDDEWWRIRYCSVTVDPRRDRLMGNAVLRGFHMIYSGMLFRDGVREVLAAVNR